MKQEPLSLARHPILVEIMSGRSRIILMKRPYKIIINFSEDFLTELPRMEGPLNQTLRRSFPKTDLRFLVEDFLEKAILQLEPGDWFIYCELGTLEIDFHDEDCEILTQWQMTAGQTTDDEGHEESCTMDFSKPGLPEDPRIFAEATAKLMKLFIQMAESFPTP